MRAVAFVAVALLLSSEVADAQRVPTRGGRLGGRTGARAPLPPQPERLLREMRYVQLPLAYEAYPFVSYMHAPQLGPGLASSWSTVGVGNRLSLRFNSVFSGTFDVTTSLLGGPSRNQTVELGVRAMRGGWPRVNPFADLRFGYVQSSDVSYSTFEDPFLAGTSNRSASSYSQGVGAVAGGGVSFVVATRTFLTVGVHAMRTRMRPHQIQAMGAELQPYDLRFRRVSIGLTYNPVRAIQSLPSVVSGH